MKIFFLVLALFYNGICFSQIIQSKLQSGMSKMELDSQFKHASISLYVVESKSGQIIFEKNSQMGLAPASCLKVMTSVAALELLGKDYRYKTNFSYNGHISEKTLYGDLFITASGDPSFGSWRWDSTKQEAIQQKLLSALKAKSIKKISGNFIINDSKWSVQTTPKGWTWEDIGNYYGAGARGVNWHENQYDLFLQPGKNVGDSVQILQFIPPLYPSVLINELITGKQESGDNSVIYLPENGLLGYVKGTIPAGNEAFKISGAMPNASMSFALEIENFLQKNNINLSGQLKTSISYFLNKEQLPLANQGLMSIYSPPLDSINYWFLQKSVNLYGEAFVKTIAYEKTNFGSTDTGIGIITDFWNKNGIEKSALHIIDGSGLSPANRITTQALVKAMQYAQKQDYYASFYSALPTQNGIKMKSGYIGGVRSYTGYVTSSSGAEYIFSFIINNFYGSAGAVREKMWKLLDILK